MLVRFSAASCVGSAPTTTPCTPFLSTRHGTSTQQPSGKFVMCPRFGMLPLMRVGRSVSIASTMNDPYSCVRSVGSGSEPSIKSRNSWSARVAHSCTCRKYPPVCPKPNQWSSGFLKRGTNSLFTIAAFLRKYGRYSLACPEDSVTK